MRSLPAKLEKFICKDNAGGAALEYIIVSAFGLILSLSVVAYFGKVAKDRLQKVSQKSGVAADPQDLGFGP